jgi:hypothetical protein
MNKLDGKLRTRQRLLMAQWLTPLSDEACLQDDTAGSVGLATLTCVFLLRGKLRVVRRPPTKSDLRV